MKSFKLLSIGIFLIIATPISSSAQIRKSDFATGSVTETTQFSKGTETIKVNTRRVSSSDGSMNSQAMSVTMSGTGVEGAVNDLLIQSFEQMMPGNDISMNELTNMNQAENMLKNQLLVEEEGFSMTASMSINLQDAEVVVDTLELTDVLRVDNFETLTETDSFASEIGFVSSFE
jgi:hypothetical protein